MERWEAVDELVQDYTNRPLCSNLVSVQGHRKQRWGCAYPVDRWSVRTDTQDCENCGKYSRQQK